MRLAEAIQSKGGNFFMLGDVVGKHVLVTEDMGLDTEIRRTTDEKYFCLQVSCEGEVKDLHLPSGALKAISVVMPENENWKGQRFVVTAITGKGYKTKTHVENVSEVDAEPEKQTRIPLMPVKREVSETGVQVRTDGTLQVFLGAIEAQSGEHVTGDDALRTLALMVADGDHTKAGFLLSVAKYSGRIKNVGGCWSVVK